MHAYDSQKAQTNVSSIETKLSELDGVFKDFCSRHNFNFSPTTELWPRRRVWCRQEIDRCMDLTMEIGVEAVLDNGFYPELPWSLYASGSFRPGTGPDVRILSQSIFQHLPFSRLATVLTDELERGYQIFNSMTESQIIREGLVCGTSDIPPNIPNGTE